MPEYGVIIEEHDKGIGSSKSYEVYNYASMANINERIMHEAIAISGHFVLAIKTASLLPYRGSLKIFDIAHRYLEAETKLYNQAKRTAKEVQSKESSSCFTPKIIDKTSREKESQLAKELLGEEHNIETD